jgi:hypothetical protein
MAGKKAMPAPGRRTTTGGAADAMPADDRRIDQEMTRPEDLPQVESGAIVDDVVGGGTTPKIDGGVDQHPVHDEDQEDRTPSDYEREIDRLDAATRTER